MKPSKKIIILLLLIGFLGVSVFHLILMNSGHMMSSHTCYGVLTETPDCPMPSEGLLSSFSYHLGALRAFLQVMPEQGSGLLFSMFAFVIALGSLLFVALSTFDLGFTSRRVAYWGFWRPVIPLHYKIAAWYSLLEKRSANPALF